MYFFIDFELQLGNSKEFNNERMKVQVKRTFKSYFLCHQKSNKKADRLCVTFTLTSSTSVQRCLYPPFQNQSPIFCFPLFSENYLYHQGRINKMVKKHTVNYHPSPSQLISRIHLLVFLRGLSLQNLSWIFY